MEAVKYNFEKMERKLKKYLDEDRFQHTLGVMYTAAALAMAYRQNIPQAQVAGLLHDCAKCVPAKKKLKFCKEYHIPVTEFEVAHPFLLHAKVGALIAKEKYGIDDPAILNAITWHTTGKPEMSTLEKIIYIADYIEPARNKAPRLEEIRRLAFQDLDQCMYEILSDSLAYLQEHPEDIDTATVQAYEYYRKLMNNSKSE